METIGIDIGGSHITGAIVDIDKGEIVFDTYIRKKLDSTVSAAVTIRNWVAVIREIAERYNARSINIGFAMPGPFDYRNGIFLIKEQSKYRSLYGLNVKRILKKELQDLVADVYFNNDAVSFLIGEVHGRFENENSGVLGLTLGTGLGSAIYKNGIYTDADLWDTPYKDGIAEDYFSTRWFLKRFYELSNTHVADVKEIAGLYHENQYAKQAFMEFGAGLADFISMLSKNRPVEKVILGGNISLAFPFFSEHIRSINMPVIPSVMGENAAMIGAALGQFKTIYQN